MSFDLFERSSVLPSGGRPLRRKKRGRVGAGGDPSGPTLYLSQIERYPPLTLEEEEELRAIFARDPVRVRQRFIEGGLRYVVFVAGRYSRMSPIPLDDLIAAGNAGLVIAAERYDPRVGARFLGFADWWIRNQIQTLFQDIHPALRVSSQVSQYSKKLIDENARRQAQGKGRLTLPEAVEYLGIREETVRLAWKWVGGGEEEFSTAGEEVLFFLADEEDVEEGCLGECERSHLRALLDQSSLTLKEREVLNQVHGLEDEPPVSPLDLAERWGLSHQAVYARLGRAYDRLRRDPLAPRLRLLWEDLGGRGAEEKSASPEKQVRSAA